VRIERRISKTETKAYDVPAEYLGKAQPEQAVNALAPEPDATVAPATAAPSTADVDRIERLRSAVSAALAKNGGEILRSQLSVKLSDELKKEPQADRLAMFALLAKNDFLATIPGTTFDNKVLKVSAPAADAAEGKE